MEEVGLFGLLVLVADVIALYKVLMGTSSVTRKAIWTIAILIFPLVGVIAYFLAAHKDEDARIRR
jgi:hypothetical protein